MSKDIYSIRQDPSQANMTLFKFDGNWTDTAQALPNSGGSAGYPHTLFTFKGKLYALSVSATNRYVYEWTGAAWSLAATLAAGSASTSQCPMSNVFIWRGAARFFAIHDQSAETTLFLYRFDGSSLTAQNVSGSFGNIRLLPYLNADHAVTLGTTLLRVIQHDDRLVLWASIGCFGTVGDVDSGAYNAYYRIDPSDVGCLVDTDFIDPTITNFNDTPHGRYWYTPTVFNDTNRTSLDKWLLKGGLNSMFSFKGKLYVVGVTGEIREVIAGVLQASVVFDLRDIPGTTVNVTAENTTFANYTFAVATPTSSAEVSAAAFFLGAKVSGAVTGTITAKYTTGSHVFYRVLDGAGVLVSAITAGTVTAARGRYRAHNNVAGFNLSNYFNMAPMAPMFHEHNGIGFLVVPGQWARTDTEADALKSWVVKWDGVGTTFGVYGTTGLEATELTRTGSIPPNFSNYDSYLDPEDGTIHIRLVDLIPLQVHHLIYDTSDNSRIDVGVVTSTWSPLSQRVGPTDVNFVGWNLNEGGVTTTSILKNVAGTQVTLSYKLFSADSHTLTVSIEYDIGNGWTETATAVSGTKSSLASSPGGTNQSYVHNAGIDIPGFTGDVAYRIRVV